MALPYNPSLKDRAKALRKAGNMSEALLWNRLKKGQFLGLDFDRQKIIGDYIVDFYCAARGLIIEIDGISHDAKTDYDAKRDAFLLSLGLGVIHVQDTDVKRNMAGVIEYLHTIIGSHAIQAPPRQASPATPPREGNDQNPLPSASLIQAPPRQASPATPPREGKLQKIADCLSSVDELIAAQTQKVEALKAHKKGLMQQLFPSPEESMQ